MNNKINTIISEFRAADALMQLSAELMFGTVLCTCAVQEALIHKECIDEVMRDDVTTWMDQNVEACLGGFVSKEKFLKEFVVFIEKRALFHLEKHLEEIKAQGGSK